jgi:hypothetical protein
MKSAKWAVVQFHEGKGGASMSHLVTQSQMACFRIYAHPAKVVALPPCSDFLNFGGELSGRRSLLAGWSLA